MVHGIPGDRVLEDGDVISIDCGAIVDGWHGDAAITVAVGDVRPDVLELMRVTEDSLWAGLAAARLGGRVTDISHAVEGYVRSQPHPSGGSYGILEDFTGHGIGTAMHQPPNVPNYGRPGRGPKLERGLALAVEPMVTLGSKHTELADDEWTVVTDDGSWAAHFEHTFTLTPERRLDPHRRGRREGQARGARRSLRRGLRREAVPAALHPGRGSSGRQRVRVVPPVHRPLRARPAAGQPRPRRDAPVDLGQWSGILLGGGPWNASDVQETKSAAR